MRDTRHNNKTICYIQQEEFFFNPDFCDCLNNQLNIQNPSYVSVPRCNPGRCRQGASEPKVTRRRCTVPEHHLPFRELNPVPQQHDSTETDPASVAGGGRSSGQEQAKRPGCTERAAGGREKKVAPVSDSGGQLFLFVWFHALWFCLFSYVLSFYFIFFSFFLLFFCFSSVCVCFVV